MASILVVDDDENIARSLQERLQSSGHEVGVASNGREALRRIRHESPDLVLLDIQLPEMDGLQVLEKVRQEGIETTVVLITAYATLDRAVQAMRAGAYDFIQKPFEPAQIEQTIRRATERAALRRENQAFRLAEEEFEPVAEDPVTRALLETSRRAAAVPSTVLLLGESGSGKEVVARQIHRGSPRRDGPFVAVNCVALNENLLESELFGHEKGAFTGAVARRRGKIELAHRGTLFLDEIGDISPAFQAKLLRVLEEKSFQRVGGEETLRADVRIIAATNRDLKRMVADKAFREDLYFRLNVLSIRVPPLRERKGDIEPLARRFVAAACRDAHRTPVDLSADALRALQGYGWPGNVRELKNVIERTVALLDGDVIRAEDLPEDVRPADALPRGTFHAQVEEYRRRLIREALERNGGNQTRAAEELGLQRTYLARLIRTYGL